MENEQKDILKELSSFTGTERYHQASILYDLNLTDGINHLRNKLNCYWLIDIVGSVQHLEIIKANVMFILWKIKVNPDKSFIVRAYKDYNSNLEENSEENTGYLLYQQTGTYTDFKLNEYEFYQNGNVLLLKSEY